jgi:hypothetical protein
MELKLQLAEANTRIAELERHLATKDALYNIDMACLEADNERLQAENAGLKLILKGKQHE